MMLGKVVVESYVPSSTDRPGSSSRSAAVTNRKLHDVSFELFKGEILGFYGLVGAGKTEVARVLYGIDPYQGEILSMGRAVQRAQRPRRPGAGHLPGTGGTARGRHLRRSCPSGRTSR